MIRNIVLQIVCIVALIISSTTGFANQILPESVADVSETIMEKTIRVLSLENGYDPKWFVTSGARTIQLRNPPATMYEVISIKASGDGKLLAVMSAGEGHPEIGIFKLSDIFEDKSTEVIYGIDPYPGVVDLIEWQGHFLHITSNLFLSERVGKYGRTPDTLSLFSVESFLLDTTSGDISPVSEKLKKPVDYYGKHLLETPDEYSPSTELWAFSELNDSKAVPYLETALTMKRYSKSKNDISALLLTLKNTE